MTLCFEQPDNVGFVSRCGKSVQIRTSSRFESVFTPVIRGRRLVRWASSIPARQEGEGNLRYRSAPNCGLITLSGLTPHSAPESLRHPLTKRAAAGDSSALTQPSRFARACAEPRFNTESLVSTGLDHDRTLTSLFENLANRLAEVVATFWQLPQGTAPCF